MKLRESIKRLLNKAGLKEEEIHFYITLLGNQGKSIYEIGKKAGLSKNKSYKVFSNLHDLGIVGYTGSGQFKFAFPSSLEPLTKELDRKRRTLGRTSDKLKKIEKLIPYLDSKESDASIEILEGEDIHQDYFDLLDQEWDTVFAYGDFEMFCEEFGFEQEKRFIDNRVKKGRKGKGIFNSNGMFTKDVTSRDTNELRKSILVENDSLKNTWVYTYDKSNTTSIWTKDDNDNFQGIIIRNKAVSDLHKSIFKDMWLKNHSSLRD
jgi:sugar-specific transcriptional regulator TrmB